jgi:integrase
MGVYKHGKGWQAAVCVKGERRRANFRTQAEAKAWANQVAAEMNNAHEPVLGGPTRTTLAEMLFEYAHLYTIGKKGALQELTRINRYLVAAGLARLRLRETDGLNALVQQLPKAARPLPSAFATLRDERTALHERTAAKRAELANKLVARISRSDLREFVTTMQTEGLSGSDIQKEMALLKHAFNQAIDEWSWSGFVNPASRLKLPKPAPARQVRLKSDEQALLLEALEACDSPFIVPLLEFAIETTARRKSLLTLTWDDVDLQAREALFRDTKTGDNVCVPLTQYAVELLEHLPRTPGEPRVFPLTAEALQNIWKRVREKTGLERLQFRDMRHVGATRHGKRLGSPHLLRLMTGHRSTKMLEAYINFQHDDVLEKLDATEPHHPTPPTLVGADAETLRAQRKIRRLNAGGHSARSEASSDEPAARRTGDLPVRTAVVVDLQVLRERRGVGSSRPHSERDAEATAH